MEEISYRKLLKLMKKGKAPNTIIYNGQIYDYCLANSARSERLEDIRKYGLWNNGGYVGESIYGSEYLQHCIDNRKIYEFMPRTIIIVKKN